MTIDQINHGKELENKIAKLRSDISVMTHGDMLITKEPDAVLRNISTEQWNLMRMMAIESAKWKLAKATTELEAL